MIDFKTLFLDTEWSYAINYGFPSKKPQFNPARNIKNRQFCINAGWKWLDKTQVHHVSVLDDMKAFKKDFRNDRVCAVKLHKVMSEADIIVCHNADFDIKMLNVLFVLYELGEIPEKKIICTLKIARRYFRFAGNGLDDLLKLFGHEGKEEKPDWALMTEGDVKQIKKSIKYCARDVVGLEIIFKKLTPYVRNLLHPRDKAAKEYYGITCCDACGSKRLHNKGVENLVVNPYPRVKCVECNHNMRGDMKMWKRAHNL